MKTVMIFCGFLLVVGSQAIADNLEGRWVPKSVNCAHTKPKEEGVKNVKVIVMSILPNNRIAYTRMLDSGCAFGEASTFNISGTSLEKTFLKVTFLRPCSDQEKEKALEERDFDGLEDMPKQFFSLGKNEFAIKGRAKNDNVCSKGEEMTLIYHPLEYPNLTSQNSSSPQSELEMQESAGHR